jgi:3-hydroxyisobutyrate dehydrogenase-like beta-hydroxyacid dehydrogenase
MKTNVCVLGAGRMGSAIVRAFLKNAHPTWVWNRTASKSQPLAAEGNAKRPLPEHADV